MSNGTNSGASGRANSRDRILQALRAARAPFGDAAPHPESYEPVTRLSLSEDSEESGLLTRFTAEVERLTGKVHVAENPPSAIQVVLDILGSDQAVLAWDNLPLPGLTDTLTTHNIKIIVPRARRDQRSEVLTSAEPIRVGITGADAAFATTGTLVLVANDQQGRLPSLLPPIHVALLRRERLVPRMEDWLKVQGRQAMLDSNSIVFVTGPSRSSDIEMQTILGVHGPREVHIVVF